ncbi:hypothetical protein DPMN_185502 [Dreissena polymorpha]|uniref:TIR domain-containing protein n=1 Tax=Dreissena polymorpha TaxID=45954 RepID=A0A9D4DJT6_DREPO|nr:hypothetical protein DPMN_185502 [Dreissena polymorpha]
MYPTVALSLTVCMFIACSSACSTSCVCIKHKATCRTPDPSGLVLSEHIREVVLQDLNASLLTNNTFSANSQWSQIETLEIWANGGESLGSRVFTGLSGLTYLGYHNEHMFYMEYDAFYGLDHLKELDFSTNIRLQTMSFLISMYSKNLPRLNKLTLTGLHSYYVETINADYNFFQSIAGLDIQRNITYLDISNVTFGEFNFQAFIQNGLCDSVHKVYLRYATFLNIQGYVAEETCSSLEVLDISDSLLPNIMLDFTISKIDFLCRLTMFYFNIEELYINGLGKYMMTPPLQDDRDGDLSSCPYKMRKLSLENNLIKRLNYTVKLHNDTQKTMEWISLAGNILEFISPLFLSPSFNLKYLDLSSNQLHKMQEHYEDMFELLIQNNTKLNVLKLNRNGIARIPSNMFLTNTELEVLDLSDNNLSSLDFNIGRLTNLKVLNLSYNAISYIDAQTRDTMEQLAAATNSHKLRIDLSNMPYICSCDDNHMETIQWIHRNLDTFITSPREDYMCTLQDERLYIFQNALEKTKSYCRVQRVKRDLAISLSIVCVFLLIGIAVFLKIQGIRRRQRERKNLLSQIEVGKFPKKFLAFLSFSSDDAELVVNTILPRLNSELQLKTGTSRVLVCSGDRHFRPGYALGEEIIRCIEDSAVTILAVSKNFCQKEWCRKEVQETYDQNKPIVLLLLERVEPDDMGKVLRKLFSRYAHASWISDSNGGHIEPDWSILCDALLDLTVEQSEKNTFKLKWLNWFSS